MYKEYFANWQAPKNLCQYVDPPFFAAIVPDFAHFAHSVE